MTIPREYLDYVFPCPECGYEDNPDFTVAHLAENYKYTVEEAEQSLNRWIYSMEVGCITHGSYPRGWHFCPHCHPTMSGLIAEASNRRNHGN